MLGVPRAPRDAGPVPSRLAGESLRPFWVRQPLLGLVVGRGGGTCRGGLRASGSGGDPTPRPGRSCSYGTSWPRPRPPPVRPPVRLSAFPSVRPSVRMEAVGASAAPRTGRRRPLRPPVAPSPSAQSRAAPRPPSLPPAPPLSPPSLPVRGTPQCSLQVTGHGRRDPRTHSAASSSGPAPSPPYSPRSSFRKLLLPWLLPWSPPVGSFWLPLTLVLWGPGRRPVGPRIRADHWPLSGGRGRRGRAGGHPLLLITPARLGLEPRPLPPPGGRLWPPRPLRGPPRSPGGKGRGLPIVRKQQLHVAGTP